VTSIARLLSLSPSRVRYLSTLHLKPSAHSVPMVKDPAIVQKVASAVEEIGFVKLTVQ
jgi:hypothetical protein